ncbi:MAG: exodeoxyribonuclease VII large subunit, partial [Muribaculaceae bacterium]|nr:exodeoxyribonuclease VII large subunit [Muribaculaceae bacterium]
MNIAPLTLLDINRRISDAIASTPGLANVWLVAETSDLRCTGGHCYMELIDKDEATGSPRARARATIWASRFARLNAEFRAATGSPLTSNIKIMVQATATFHPVYGLSLNITDVNPEYTLGDLLRRRREMIARLQAEGILNCNRELQWPPVPWRIAVISAAGAAGYGDFIDQLYNNSYRLRFSTRLFEARMQGEDTAPSIIAALERIAAADESYDCVVIIRGGGDNSDLAAFDNSALAANIALF